MAEIFICYRRDESVWSAGRICDYLKSVFGSQRIFIDTSSILVGDDFIESIKKEMQETNIVIVVIGPKWNEKFIETKSSKKTDFVLYEIETALSLNKSIIPILVDGATMPEINDLPESIYRLHTLNGVEITANKFYNDIKILENRLISLCGNFSREILLNKIKKQPNNILSLSGRAALRTIARIFNKNLSEETNLSHLIYVACQVIGRAFVYCHRHNLSYETPPDFYNVIKYDEENEFIKSIIKLNDICGFISSYEKADSNYHRVVNNVNMSHDAAIYLSETENNLDKAISCLLAIGDTDQDGLNYDLSFIDNNLKNSDILIDFSQTLINRSLWDDEKSKINWEKVSNEIMKSVSNQDQVEHWVDWISNQVQGVKFELDLQQNLFVLPEEIEYQGIDRVNMQLKKIASRAAKFPLNRVRVIFLGHGGSGKTTIIKALHGEEVTEGVETMTQGVHLSERKMRALNVDVNITENADIFIHYWDFGGQVMVHHTHQFFLRSQCIYVVVVDGRRNEKVNDDVRYWLEHIRAYGGSSPTLIVSNKLDLSRAPIDQRTIKTLFPNIKDFFHLSATQYNSEYKREFDIFSNNLYESIQSMLSSRQVLFTRPEFAILNEVRKYAKKNTFLTVEDFEEIYKKYKEYGYDEEEKHWLVDILDKLGIVIYFPDISPNYLLGPEWLTKGIYSIMYSSTLRNNYGKISLKNLKLYLKDMKIKGEGEIEFNYGNYKADYILEVMHKFKVVYKIVELEEDIEKNTSEKSFYIVVPSLLNENQPIHSFSKEGAWAYRFRFDGFFPPHLVPSLIVDRHAEIVGRDKVWQFGAHIESKNCNAEAFFQSDEHIRTLTIWVRGEDANEYLTILRDQVLKEMSKLEKLSVCEEIKLDYEMCEKNVSINENNRDLKEVWAPYMQVKTAIARCDKDFIGPDGVIYQTPLLAKRLPKY